MNFFLTIIILSSLIGCSSIPSKSELFLKETHNKPLKKIIKNVPYILQKENYCGPATLAMYLGYLGNPKTPDELAILSFSKKAKGTFKEDLISAARIQGYTTVPVKNYHELVKEIKNDNPVIVFQNLGFDWYPLWHYALVYGYDLNDKTLTLHTGPDKAEVIGIKMFDKSWKRGGYWGQTITLPNKLSATGTELDHIRSAAALESLKKYGKAKTAYLEILKRFPKSFMSYFGLGNIDFYQNKLHPALKNYEKALSFNFEMPLVWYNKALIFEKLKNFSKASISAKSAIKYAPLNQKAIYQMNLEHLIIKK